MPTQTSDFWKLFKPKASKIKLVGTSKAEVFDEIVGTMVQAALLDEAQIETAKAALLAREELASTGVGMGVAIPHVEVSGLQSAVVSLCRHPDGIDWGAVDGSNVHLFFTVLRPAVASDEHDPERHLDMMRWISRLGRESDFRRFAMGAANRTELVGLLKEMAST